MGYFIPGALLIFLCLSIDNLGYNDLIIDYFDVKGNYNIEDILFFIIVSYSLGHLVNFLSSMTIEKFAVWKYDYPSKFLLGYEKKDYWKKNNKSGYLLRGLLPILIFPVAFFDLFIGEFLNVKDLYTRKLDAFLIEVIKHKGVQLANLLFNNEEVPIDPSERKSFNLENFDFFRVFAHYAYENSKKHQEKLNNYVALYGFLRTLTLISIITFWYSAYQVFIAKNSCVNSYIIIASALCSYLFFMAFMKFYRRYTLEGLMIITVDKEIK